MPRVTTPRRSKTAQDEFLRGATSNYNYCDSTIKIQIDGETFSVSRNRLSMRSAVFTSLFSLPEGMGSEADTPLQLRSVDADEFKDYLWYIHADPLCAKNFFDQVPSTSKSSRLLGIANVCHQYDAMDVAVWALKEALGMPWTPFLGRSTVSVDIPLARRLLNVASRWQDSAHASHVSKCRDIVCDALHPERNGPLAQDPIAVVEVAQQDTFVLAHVYYYILRKEEASDYDWKGDARLTPVDRRRLLCGSYALSRMRAKAPKAPAEPQPPPPQPQTAQPAPSPLRVRISVSSVSLDVNRMPRVAAEIKDKRNDLWAMFDAASWNL